MTVQTIHMAHQPDRRHSQTESYTANEGNSTSTPTRQSLKLRDEDGDSSNNDTLQQLEPLTAHTCPNRPQLGRSQPNGDVNNHQRSNGNSTTAWKLREIPITRKIIHYALPPGPSTNFPVPIGIQDAIQPEYRADLESGSEEFTRMRCNARHRRALYQSC